MTDENLGEASMIGALIHGRLDRGFLAICRRPAGPTFSTMPCPDARRKAPEPAPMTESGPGSSIVQPSLLTASRRSCPSCADGARNSIRPFQPQSPSRNMHHRCRALRAEGAILFHDEMRNVVVVRPDNCCPDGDGQCRRREGEICDLYLRLRRERLRRTSKRTGQASATRPHTPGGSKESSHDLLPLEAFGGFRRRAGCR